MAKELAAVTEESIARVAHEVNRAYCASLGDDSQPKWGEAPQWQRDSALKGVEFHIANPGASPSASHDSWMEQKRSEGWIWGPDKKPDATPPEHPCFMPYEMLPPQQKAKDFIFKAIVESLQLVYVN